MSTLKFISFLQLALFGFDRGAHVDFLEKSSTAFKHLFLQNWQPAFETMPYPPATGAFALYTIPAFYDSVNFALRQVCLFILKIIFELIFHEKNFFQYNLTEQMAIGTYHFSDPSDVKPPVEMCMTAYKLGKISAHNQSYIFDDTKVRGDNF
jgi:mucolipin 3/mucolipin